MYYRSKYVIVDAGMAVFPIVFTELINHSDMVQGIAPGGQIIGAGFCYIEKDLYVCYGESISLNVKSRGNDDSKILNKYLGAHNES